jgi:hypothetical protein
MYKLINVTTGETRNVEIPRYVRMAKNGVWIFCTEDDAQCLVISGKRFSISGKEPVADAPEVVIVKQVDAGEEIQELFADRLKQAETLEEVKSCIVDIYDVLLNLVARE